ncbi:MAG: DNA gyrase inhibitor YacG [Acidobacteriaceae bacterium]|nr:DNA gyrase inhibitor YacG [Acidobacteriaceae bacterium]
MAVSTVRCPICKKEVSRDDPNMPFCSDRCRMIDLGNWASEKYVISTPAAKTEIEDIDEHEGPRQ